ncbi:MAG: hypothetical protein ACYDHO_08270 [Gaiellaceae bacterium]
MIRDLTQLELPAPVNTLEPSTASAVLAELDERLSWEVLEPARMAGIELAFLGVTAKPSEQFLARTPRGTWIIASSHLDDPTVRETGKIHIPAREHERLVALEKAGVRCDLVWIAHELPREWQPGQPIPSLVPPAPRFRELDVRLARHVQQAVKRSARIWLRVARAGLTVVAAPALLFDAGGIGADPVILGGIAHESRDAVVWYELASWHWE